jgi:RNA polymerase sigma factor (sigma-70 family)
MKDINLIRKLAWSFYYTTGIDWNELFSEVSLAYCEALQNFNPKKNNKFITFAYVSIRNHMITYLSRRSKQIETIPIEDLEYADHIFTPFNDLDEWTLEVIDTINQKPLRYLKTEPHRARLILARDLKNSGWKRIHIIRSFAKLKKVLN